MNINIYVLDKFHNDLNFKDKKSIGIFLAFLHFHEKVRNNLEFSSVMEIQNLVVNHES